MAKAGSSPLTIYLLWIVVTAIGWLAGIFSLDASAKTYMDIIHLLPIYFADGLLIGLVVGIGQALVLRKFMNPIYTWVLATTFGYVLAFITGSVVSVLIPSLVWFSHGEYLLPFAVPSTVSIRLSADDLFYGGILLGVIQWPVLKKIIPSPDRNKGILWILTTWFALGMTMFVRAFTYGNWLANFQKGAMGIVVGAISGLVLLMFLSNSQVAEQAGN